MIVVARLVVIAGCMIAAALSAAGCREVWERASAGADGPDAGMAGAKPLGLEETFNELRACFERKSYLAMLTYIDPARRDNLIATLVAMDELMAANTAAMESIREHYPEANVEDFDLSYFKKDLELFSEQIEFDHAVEQGDTAVIVADIPVRDEPAELHFARHEGRWVYVPDFPDVADRIIKLSRSLNRLSWLIRHEGLTFDQMRDDYKLRITPKWLRMVEAADAQSESL